MTSPTPHRRPIVRWIFLIAFPLLAAVVIYGTVGIIAGQITDNRSTRGTVISIDHVSAGKASACTEKYEYTVDGSRYDGSSSPHCAGKVGGAVTVRYDPRNPSQSDIDGPTFSIFMDITLVIISLLLIFATLVIWTYQRSLWRKSREST